MEKLILEAAICGRPHYEQLAKYNIRESLSDQGQLVWDLVDEYYIHDTTCDYVDRALLVIALERKYPKHGAIFKVIIEGLEPTSPDNLLYEIKEQKKSAVKMRLAQAFASDNENLIGDLLVEYEQLIVGDIDVENDNEVLIAPDLGQMMEARSMANRIKVLPEALNTVLEGGALRGHHIVLYAVTDIGKTLMALNMVRGFIEDGYKVLYVGNEDPVSDLIERFLVSLIGKDKWAIRKHWKKAQELAIKKGWGRLVWAELSPGTLTEIRSLIETHKPDVLVVDQIRNLNTGDKNFVRTLEVAAQGMRNFAKKYNLLSISITQAGDSANGKAILNRGDIDNSNVGIPGTADLMLGVGATHDDEINGIRTLSFAKNKISGNKSPVQCFFNTQNMRVE